MEGGKEEIWNTLESYNILEKLFLEEEKEAFDLGYYLKIHKKVTIGILLYLSGTLLLYYMGPFRWETRSPIYFIAINILYLLALWMGLFIGARTRGGYSNMSPPPTSPGRHIR